MSRIDTNKGLIAWFARNNVAANLLSIQALPVTGLCLCITEKLYPNFDSVLRHIQELQLFDERAKTSKNCSATLIRKHCST